MRVRCTVAVWKSPQSVVTVTDPLRRTVWITNIIISSDFNKHVCPYGKHKLKTCRNTFRSQNLIPQCHTNLQNTEMCPASGCADTWCFLNAERREVGHVFRAVMFGAAAVVVAHVVAPHVACTAGAGGLLPDNHAL